MARTGVDAENLAGTHSHAQTCAAEEDAPVKLSGSHARGKVECDVRIVTFRLVQVIEVGDVYALTSQMLQQDGLQVRSNRIAINRHFHAFHLLG